MVAAKWHIRQCLPHPSIPFLSFLTESLQSPLKADPRSCAAKPERRVVCCILDGWCAMCCSSFPGRSTECPCCGLHDFASSGLWTAAECPGNGQQGAVMGQREAEWWLRAFQSPTFCQLAAPWMRNSKLRQTTYLEIPMVRLPAQRVVFSVLSLTYCDPVSYISLKIIGFTRKY